ncbi:toluene-4-monooxygenase system B family protein [Streptomyces sp. AK02-04a]|uniref:toluene-4-monooxygenase system B family protein n=1 Tax=Streptomyces sp. AK02-04a TaxID=3028649 RepID=UPI0029A2399B|nr:toluene-4-monooxygenase system B family protein [Streptomyces sp. AK02-04a]MDX3763656.1 toluene-4-monooxygenase system B family protein [Streptomyces sp. AK02-04a]
MSVIFVRAVFDGDLMVRLIPIDDADSLAVVAETIAHQAVGVMLPPQDRPIEVWHDDNRLDPKETVKNAGIGPMDILRVAYA